MPMNRETGKDRWRRIPKDYFKTRDRLQGAKLQLSFVAFVLSLAWVVLGVDWKGKNPLTSTTDLNSLRANHGTLARAHAAWDTKCDACHVPFEPIDGRSLFASTSSASNRSSDKLCMSCHAGPAHHSAAIEAEVKGCAECHRDHQGREFSLVRLPDGECTNCHSNLEAHVDTTKKPLGSRMFAKVARFNAQDHPAFAPDAAIKSGDKLQDRGKLKFNHARHMMPGIVKKPGDTPYTVESIPVVAERARYQAGGKPTDPVQLDCSSCHRLDSTEVPAPANPAFPSASLPARSPGRYYLPVTFETSCRACHTLTFDPRMKDVEVPHGVQPDQVADFLRRTYAAQVLSDDPKLLDVFVPPVRLPGKTPVQPSAKKRLDEAVSHALAAMFPKDAGPASNANNCLECHHYGKDQAVGVPTSVEPTKVPQVWFTHATFDHTAHRGVSCRDCHTGSYALEDDGKTTNPKASVVATDLLIPGIDNCVQCHAPARSTGGWFASSTEMTGGASFDCTECHRYHNGDRSLQGYGASAQDATVERSLVEFLKGEGGRPAKSSKP
jgi:hypothetical protein